MPRHSRPTYVATLVILLCAAAALASNTVTIDTAGSPNADVSDWTDETCIADSDPCDDFPNQQDATGACIASNYATVSPATIAYLRFDFDQTSISGNNTLDGCWLVDTNQNGNVDRYRHVDRHADLHRDTNVHDDGNRYAGPNRWKSMAVGDRYVTFGVRERTHFNQILNGDNDKIDDVLFCVGPLPQFP